MFLGDRRIGGLTQGPFDDYAEARINTINNVLDDVAAVAWSTDRRCR